MSKRAVFLISLAALASAAVFPLHPRDNESALPTNLGMVLANVALVLPNESMMSEMNVAATELHYAASRSDFQKIASDYLSFYVSSLEANNNPESASAWASKLIEFLDSLDKPVPTEISELFDACMSALHKSDIATDAADIFNEFFKFVREGYQRNPDLFYTPYDLIVPTSATESGFDINSEKPAAVSPALSAGHNDNVGSGFEEDSLDNDEPVKNDSTKDDVESDSKSSGASTNSPFNFGALAVGVALGVMTCLF
ncbi:hypothetical protein FB645_001870 [Coemansia sp. IMI 203386]|nr:hypothetical protein FB645_001870 [Coemansia sp. IMI 203386]